MCFLFHNIQIKCKKTTMLSPLFQMNGPNCMLRVRELMLTLFHPINLKFSASVSKLCQKSWRASFLPFYWLSHSPGKCRLELPQAEEATEMRSVTSWMCALGYHMKGGQHWHFQTCFKGDRGQKAPVLHTEKKCQPKRRNFHPVRHHLK